jgi:hypothetical protein
MGFVCSLSVLRILVATTKYDAGLHPNGDVSRGHPSEYEGLSR